MNIKFEKIGCHNSWKPWPRIWRSEFAKKELDRMLSKTETELGGNYFKYNSS